MSNSKIDRLEVKEKSPNEYGIFDHVTDKYIVQLDTHDYSDAKNKLVTLKTIMDNAIDNGGLDL